MSPRRRALAATPLVMALGAWFFIPSYAADFRLDSAGDRYGTITHGIGGRDSYPIRIPGFNNENAGTLLMHEIGGGDVEAYCLELRGVRNPAATFRGGDQRIDQVAYILNHFFPVVRETGGLATPDYEAAAVQLAVWTYSDGIDLGAVSAPTVASFSWVIDRARQVRADADAHSSAWAAQQRAQPMVALAFGPAAIAPGKTSLTATVTGGPDGSPPDGTPITFAVTSQGGAVDDQRSIVKTLRAGVAAVEVSASMPGDVVVSAQVTVEGRAYERLHPDVIPNQVLIVPSRAPVNGQAVASSPFAAAPRLTASKRVSNGGASAPSINARPGDMIRYTIDYANTGSAPAGAVVVTDDLGRGALSQLDVGSIVLEGGENHSLERRSRIATWTIGDIPPGGSGSVGFTAKLPPSLDDDGKGAELCNVGTITSGGSPPVASSQACLHVPTVPHLVVVKTMDPLNATAGDLVHYGVTVSNDGNRTLRGLTVSDSLNGSNLEMLSDVRPAAGGTYHSATRTVTWALMPLRGGETAVVGFDARIDASAGAGGGICMTNTVVGGGGNSGGTYVSAPATTCVHAPPPPPRPPQAGSAPPVSLVSGVPTPAAGSRGLLRTTVVAICLMASGLVMLGGLRGGTGAW